VACAVAQAVIRRRGPGSIPGWSLCALCWKDDIGTGLSMSLSLPALHTLLRRNTACSITKGGRSQGN
jgi:hypothetical protein